MKSLWTAIAIVLLLNFLAAGGFVGWLYSTDRLDRDRMMKVVELFTHTVADEAKAKQDEEAQKMKDAEAAREAARLERVASGPNELALKIAEDQEKDEIAIQRYERLKRDISDLQRTNELARRLLEEEREKLESERKAFKLALEMEHKKRTDEEFKHAVKMYEQLKPKQAKEMFQQLLTQKQTDQVLDYLAAMNLRKSTAVLKEFKTPVEVVQATDLVQRLRLRGVNLGPMEEAGAKPNPGGNS